MGMERAWAWGRAQGASLPWKVGLGAQLQALNPFYHCPASDLQGTGCPAASHHFPSQGHTESSDSLSPWSGQMSSLLVMDSDYRQH